MHDFQQARCPANRRLRLRRLRTVRRAFGLAVAALYVAPSVAQAAPFVDVTYDLSSSSAVSTVPSLNLSTEIPPHGSITGTQTIRYTGTSGAALGLATGPVQLLTFNLYVHATVGDYIYTPNGTTFTAVNTSDLHFEFLGVATGPSLGQRLSGGTVTPLGASGVFRVTGSVHCNLVCGIFNMSITQTTGIVPYVFTAPLPILTGAVGPSQTIQGTAYSVNFQVKPNPSNLGVGVTGTTFLVGREIARTPEPGTLPLLTGGLAGLGLAAASWRRLRRKA